MKFDILKPQTACGIGRKAIQEDCTFPALGDATIHDKLFVVADGEDGDGKGYVASETFCRTVSDYFFQNTCPDEPLTDELLDEALHEAGVQMAHRSPESVGTRFAMLYLHRHGCTAVHVGDARIYHIRPKDRKMLYRSADNNQVFLLSAEAQKAPVKAVITDVQYGDYFVLLTKGAHQMVSDTKLMSIVCEPVNDSTKLIRMIKELKECDDNYSVTLIHVSGVMSEAMDEHLFENERALMAGMAGVVTTGAEAARTSVDKPQPAPKPTAKATPKPSTKSTPKPVSHSEEAPRRRQPSDEVPETPSEEREEREFPVVLVTALVIVGLAIGAWYWMHGSSNKNETVEPAVEVKKDSTKKDTMNIMKNEKPKALDLMEEKKEKEKEQEKKPETKPQEEKPVVTVEESAVETPVVEEPATPAAPTQTEELKSEVTPIQQADPNNVTPKPVIPEEDQ